METVAATRVLRNVVEGALALGDDATVDRAIEAGTALDLSDPMAEFHVDATRLVAANARRRGRVVDLDPPSPFDPELDRKAATAAGDVLDAATAVLPDDGTTNPIVVVAVLDATSTLMEVDEVSPPHDVLQRAVDGIPAQPDTAVLRAQAELMLADLHLRLDGPAAAMVHQRLAIEAVERDGPPGLTGWARRGLALQLQDLGRHDEALVQFAMSATCCGPVATS